MKGIILAGGSGTRLYPSTKAISKQLIPIYDKPMIYYPLSMLMLAGIREVLIISTKEDISKYESLLSNGKSIGMKFSYKIQPSPDGLAQAFILGEDFIGNDNVCLILGDNIFYGDSIPKKLREAVNDVNTLNSATVFVFYVNDPERYGVVEFDSDNRVISLEEKPNEPRSNYAVPGLYIYDKSVVSRTKKLSLSGRGELEITDLNRVYLEDEKLDVSLLGRGVAWLDTGTPESMIEASNFIAYIESRQGLKISCIEEVAFNMSFINFDQLVHIVNKMPSSSYKTYLESFVNINREI